jgi:hypothetical protein
VFLGIWQALCDPRFLELPGRLVLFLATATYGQKEAAKLGGNSDIVTIRNKSLVAGRLRALATPLSY